MNRSPQPANRIVEIARGISAVVPGVLWLHESRSLVAADVHLAYEDVIGSVLPLWSTTEIVDGLRTCATQMYAREIILLGDVIHSGRMSEGAARHVRSKLDALRAVATLTIVAGNHEGRTRGTAILENTVEYVERDGWLLLHGDRAPKVPQRSIIGHLHPSLPIGKSHVPAFLAGNSVIVVPALTPYSSGLDASSKACIEALRAFNVAKHADLHVVAVTKDLCYPFGTLSRFLALAR